jgi:citrate lyase subunit beta/citryl-CoA lyase
MIYRSLLFIPGNNLRYLQSAAKSDADAFIIDLEDSVAPNAKQEARDTARSFLDTGAFSGRDVFVRVNEPDMYQDDLRAFGSAPVKGFALPKAERAADIHAFERELENLEHQYNLPAKHFSMIAMLETCAAILHAEEVFCASERILAGGFGCEDFLTDLKGLRDPEMLSLLTPRALVALAARSAGIIPIDTVHTNVHDLEDLERNHRIARILGYEGAFLLHPKEIDTAHRCFSPTEEEYRSAVEMLVMTREAYREGKGEAIRNGVFLGPPMKAKAEALVARYERLQAWERTKAELRG